MKSPFSLRWAWGLLLLPALLLLWQLDYAPFWNPDEGRYAAASFEMAFGLGNGKTDWLVPHLNTLSRLNKPPLVYWLAGGSFSTFGPSEWSGRLVPALAAIAVLVVLFCWNRARFGTRAGLGAACVWATMLLPFALARTLNTDMLLTASMTLALWGLSGAIRSPHRAGAAIGVGLGLALLAKGPVGVALPAGIWALHALFTRRSEIAGKSWFVALLLAAMVGLPWYFAVAFERPEFLRGFLFSENLARFSGGGEFHESKPFFYYLPVMLAGMFPWTGFLGGLGVRLAPDKQRRRAIWFLWIWLILVVGFFSLSGTKLISYVLPAFPALALLLGASVAQWQLWPLWARRLAIFSTPALWGAVVVGLWAVLKQGKIVPLEAVAPFLWILAAIILAGLCAWIFAAQHGRSRWILVVHCVLTGFVWMTILPLASTLARYEDASAAFVALQPVLKKDDQIVAWKSFTPSGIFYARRPLTQFGFYNSSGLRREEIAASPLFQAATEREAATFLASKHRVFWIVRRSAPAFVTSRLHLWGRNNDFWLYSNRAKPADFSFDFVAPRKRG